MISVSKANQCSCSTSSWSLIGLIIDSASLYGWLLVDREVRVSSAWSINASSSVTLSTYEAHILRIFCLVLQRCFPNQKSAYSDFLYFDKSCDSRSASSSINQMFGEHSVISSHAFRLSVKSNGSKKSFAVSVAMFSLHHSASSGNFFSCLAFDISKVETKS